MLISVHIPKTAGTAFRAILSAHFGERLYLDYAERPLAPGFRWRRLKQRLKPEHVAAGFENAYDCAHGHFIADKYDAADRPVRCIAWLRDPVERTISHFSYWKRVPDLRNPDCRMLIERNLSIEDFAALPRMRNVMTRFFGGKKPEDFFFLGTVETMAESLARFHRLTGIAVDAMPIDNRDEDGPYEDGPPHARVSASARQTIDRLNRRDRALYETVNTMLG